MRFKTVFPFLSELLVMIAIYFPPKIKGMTQNILEVLFFLKFFNGTTYSVKSKNNPPLSAFLL